MKPLSRLHLAFALVLLALLALNLQLSTAHAQGTAFTYQGQLQNTNGPVHGTYNLTFTLFNTNTSGVAIAGPVTNNAVLSTNGLFTVIINFGSSVWNGQTNWLQIAVETNGAVTFTNLSPRQQLTPVPYAIYAENAGAATIATTATSANNVAAGSVTGTSIAAGTITAANIASGQVVKSLNGLHDAVTLAAGSNITLNTNGNTLTVSSGAGGGTNGSGWGLTGNAGTTAATNFVGTTDNQPLELHVDGQRAFRLEPTAIANTPNVIGGSVLNSAASAIGAAIGGGYSNSIEASVEDSSIGGGTYNNIPTGANYSTIGGGSDNTNASFNSAVSGGYENLIQSGAGYSIIGGGDENLIAASSASSVFDFEDFEDVYGSWVSLGGGLQNTIDSAGSFIGGGYYNTIDTNSTDSVLFPIGEEYEGGWSVIGGGAQNTVSAGGSFIGGGGFNWIEPDAMWSAIAGGEGNIIDSNSYTYVFYSQLDNPGGGFSLIGGGAQNKIRTDTSFIGGGYQNDIDLDSSGSVIAGGLQNTITNSEGSSIAGGEGNLIFNALGTSDELAFPGDSTIGGGTGNEVLSPNSTIGGGVGNVISNGISVTISGGVENTATGNQATVPGGAGNIAGGQYSFAAGYNAQATNDFSFVWSDNRGFNGASYNGGPARSTGPNQFIIGAVSGVAINTSPNTNSYSDDDGVTFLPIDLTVAHGIYADALFVSGNYGIFSNGPIYATNSQSAFGDIYVFGGLSCDAVECSGSITAAGYITAGDFGMSSDRNLKEHFTQINPQDVLARVAALPVTEWHFRKEKAGVQHIGPMAQDFHAAFGLNGSDDKHISVVDEGGVALAAIQGLNQKLDEKDSEIQKLKQQNDSLAERLDELEATVKQLAARK